MTRQIFSSRTAFRCDDVGLGSNSGGGRAGAAWDLTKISRETRLDSRADMVFCAAACRAWNELGSLMANSSWAKNIARR